MSKNKEVCKKSQVKFNPQFELPQLSLMGLLQFGSQTLLEEAIRAEISET